MADGFRDKLKNISRNLGDGLTPYVPEYFPVAWKLGISISILILVGMSFLGSYIVNSQRQLMESQADQYGRTIAEQLADSSREPLLADDQFTLKVLVNNLVQRDTLLGAAIYTRDRKAIYQAGLTPSGNQDTGAKANIFQWHSEKDTEPLVSYLTPIQIQDNVAGYVAITLSRSPIHQALANSKRTIVTATILMSIIAIVVAFVVSRRLSRPIHNLLEAASQIRSGNFNFRIKERRNDELGFLIDAYNHLANGLLEKGQVERVLSRFVSPRIAKQMMADLDQVELGGKDIHGTVAFADIVGFTRLTENMAPEDVAELLNEYFEAITVATEFYRGTIDKYMGDCAMIVFGVPEEDPEHAYHGICCANMIQRMIDRINATRRARNLPGVEFRIGINTGGMLAGNLGSRDRMQYTVVGDTVNLASRLSSMAAPGDIMAHQSVVEDPNVQSRISAQPTGSMRIRGKQEPVLTYRVTGIHSHSESLMQQRIDQFMHERIKETHSA